MTHMWGHVCDRCGRAYRSPDVPHGAACRPCYLGGLSPIDRAVALVGGIGRNPE